MIVSAEVKAVAKLRPVITVIDGHQNAETSSEGLRFLCTISIFLFYHINIIKYYSNDGLWKHRSKNALINTLWRVAYCITSYNTSLQYFRVYVVGYLYLKICFSFFLKLPFFAYTPIPLFISSLLLPIQLSQFFWSISLCWNQPSPKFLTSSSELNFAHNQFCVFVIVLEQAYTFKNTKKFCFQH